MAINNNIKTNASSVRRAPEPQLAMEHPSSAVPSPMVPKKHSSEESDLLAVSASFQAKVKSLDLLKQQPPKEELPAVDGELKRMGDMLARMKALSVQARSIPLAPGQEKVLNSEFNQLKNEIQRYANATQRKGISIPYDPNQEQIPQDVDEEQISPWVASLQISSPQGLDSAMQDLDSSINHLSRRKQTLGAIQDRLTTAFTAVASHNPRASDDQSAVANLAQAQDLAQQLKQELQETPSQLYKAQANQNPKVALSLIK